MPHKPIERTGHELKAMRSAGGGTRKSEWLQSSREDTTMANIDIDKNEKMGEEELEQVKGGPAYMKLGDIKGEAVTTQMTYDLKAAKK